MSKSRYKKQRPENQKYNKTCSINQNKIIRIKDS